MRFYLSVADKLSKRESKWSGRERGYWSRDVQCPVRSIGALKRSMYEHSSGLCFRCGSEGEMNISAVECVKRSIAPTAIVLVVEPAWPLKRETDLALLPRYQGIKRC